MKNSIAATKCSAAVMLLLDLTISRSLCHGAVGIRGLGSGLGVDTVGADLGGRGLGGGCAVGISGAGGNGRSRRAGACHFAAGQCEHQQRSQHQGDDSLHHGFAHFLFPPITVWSTQTFYIQPVTGRNTDLIAAACMELKAEGAASPVIRAGALRRCGAHDLRLGLCRYILPGSSRKLHHDEGDDGKNKHADHHIPEDLHKGHVHLMALGPLRPAIFAARFPALAHLLADKAEEGIRGALHVDVHGVYMLDLRVFDVVILDCLIYDKGGIAVFADCRLLRRVNLQRRTALGAYRRYQACP